MTTATPTRPATPRPSVDPAPWEPSRWRRFIPTPKFLTLGVVSLVIAYLAIVPLYYLFWGTFFDASGFTFSGFARAYGNDQMVGLVGNSLLFAVGAAAVSLVFGTGLAYLNVRTDVPFKALFFAASIIPLVIPGILYTIAWILLGSPDIGLINHYLEPIFGRAVIDVFSIWGMIWVEGLQLSPIVFLLMVASFRSMDPSLEESALMSGASRWTVFRKVTVPLARPAIVAAILIMVVRSLESFEVPALLGLQNGIYVFTSRIYFVLRDYPPDLSAAGALAIGLLVIAIIGVVISNFAGRASKNYQTVTGKGFRPRPMELGKWRPVAGVLIIGYFLLTVIAPLLVLLYTSLLKFYAPPSKDTFKSMTLDNYRALAHTADAITALKNSLILGLASATLVMAFMAVAAWIVVRSRIPWPKGIGRLGVPATGRARAGDGPGAELRLPSQPDTDLRHAVHPAHLLLHPVSAVRHALFGHLDAADRQRTGGVGAGQRRELVADVPPGAASAADAGSDRGLDLHPRRVVP